MKRAEDLWAPWTPDSREPWNALRAAHLVRRTGFGVPHRELKASVDGGYERAIDALFALDGRASFEDEMKPIESVLGSRQDPSALASWWLLRMARTPCPFQEKVTFFWHGHFATSADKVADSVAMLNQNRLLRENALGHFEPMLQGISRDVAMLIYLDSTDNRKTRPNENYAREIMELFCLGPGNYTERDIKELARCFTGWEVRQNRFRFNKYQHDTGTKSFLGHSGDYDGDEAVRIVLEQPAAATFIARKLVRFFCTDNDIDNDLLEPLARTLRESDFDLERTIRQILTSRFFWSAESMGQKVRSPVDLAIGLIRTLGLATNMNSLRGRLDALGQLPMFPPNVKGWEGGRRWINASTFVERINLVRLLAREAGDVTGQESMAHRLGISPADKPRDQIEQLIDQLFAERPPESTIRDLAEAASNSRGDLNRSLAESLVAIAATPEFHLC